MRRRWGIVRPLPNRCPCKGTELVRVQLLGQTTWFRIPCPACANPTPLTEFVEPRP